MFNLEQLDKSIDKVTESIINDSELQRQGLVKALAMLIETRMNVEKGTTQCVEYQIVNLADLTLDIQRARLAVANVHHRIKDKQLTNEQIVELLESVCFQLEKCEQFEFILERHLVNK